MKDVSNAVLKDFQMQVKNSLR